MGEKFLLLVGQKGEKVPFYKFWDSKLDMGNMENHTILSKDPPRTYPDSNPKKWLPFNDHPNKT